MIFFLPYVLADVAAGLIWRFMFDGDYGLAARITGAARRRSRCSCSPSKDWAFSAVLIVIVWKYFGFHMMLYIAGLQSIDKSLLEAAEMDGASPLPALPPHHPAAARADDPAVDLLFGGRLAASCSTSSCR